MLVLFCELREIGNVELFTMNGPMALLREWGNLLLRCNNADKERGSVGSFSHNRHKRQWHITELLKKWDFPIRFLDATFFAVIVWLKDEMSLAITLKMTFILKYKWGDWERISQKLYIIRTTNAIADSQSMQVPVAHAKHRSVMAPYMTGQPTD